MQIKNKSAFARWTMSLWQMIKHIILGFLYKIMNKNILIRDKRMEICNKCNNKDEIFCNVCGCLLDAKTRVYKEKCPLNKW